MTPCKHRLLECIYSSQCVNLPLLCFTTQNLQDFLEEIENFIAEAQETLEDAIPNSAKLQTLLDKGNSFDIELPEIPKLKQVTVIE